MKKNIILSRPVLEAWCLFLNEINDEDGIEAFKRAGKSTQYGDLEPAHIIKIVYEIREERMQNHLSQVASQNLENKDNPYIYENHEENKKTLRNLIEEKFPNIHKPGKLEKIGV